MDFIVGQRWISHSETQLGLGIVTEVKNRRIKMMYPAVGESRIYAVDTAPLSRIAYAIGDTITDSNDQSYSITGLEDEDGLIVYLTTDENNQVKKIHELDLNCFVQFTSPKQRLFSGQLDKNKNFSLRINTLLQLHRLQQSSVKGLLGSRTDLLPHQIYIANNVAHRHAPRVLLADEVGLGKTIEAGMILHYQLHTGQSNRVLILVPDSLIHQWLVEMRRRFNLNFAVFDQERYVSLLEEGHQNPFESEQKIICALSIVCHNDDIQMHALETYWDMIIVDEAHHLIWHEEESSPEYQCVEKLSEKCASLLLLTATPEQIGLDSHFARLRLLDSARFHDFNAFKKEQATYHELNQLVKSLIEDTPLNENQLRELVNYLGDDFNEEAPKETISKLLDRHGTSRVLFRNTRTAVQNFPKRCPLPYPLELPVDSKLNRKVLYPESQYDNQDWLKEDPRLDWLIKILHELKPEKALIICHHAETAITLDNYLNLRIGIRSASFYEGLSILERDRAAAYFAEGSNPEEIDSGIGAQVLICSEIGSEGRNFQFAHHLILFDLPLNPDLLEQRIGRLDRIGQKQDIQIHIPYLLNTSQEILFRWLYEGIKIFSQSCSAGYEIYNHFAQRLEDLLKHNNGDLDQLIKETAEFTQSTMKNLHEGRDRLLELNSFNPKIAQQLITQIELEDQQKELIEYMELVFDQFGVNSDFHSEYSYVITPGDHMHGNFPGLREEGNTITFNRNKALRREDMEFINWEHPMVTESMQIIHNSEFGNTAVAVVSVNGLQKGTLLVETWFGLNVIANKKLQLERYLPISPIRFLLDNNNKNYSKALDYEKLGALCNSLPKKTALSIIEKTRPIIDSLLKQSQTLADRQLLNLKETAMKKMNSHLSEELERLQALKITNKSIRQDEIDYFKDSIEQSSEHIKRAKYQLQAIRIIINN